MPTADGSKRRIILLGRDPSSPPWWLDPKYLRKWQLIINRGEKTTSHPPDATQAGHPVTSGTSNQINHPSKTAVNSQGVPISTFIDSQLYRDRITHGSSAVVYDSLPESVKVALREGKLTRSRLLE